MAAAAPFVLWMERFPGSRYGIYHVWTYRYTHPGCIELSAQDSFPLTAHERQQMRVCSCLGRKSMRFQGIVKLQYCTPALKYLITSTAARITSESFSLCTLSFASESLCRTVILTRTRCSECACGNLMEHIFWFAQYSSQMIV